MARKRVVYRESSDEQASDDEDYNEAPKNKKKKPAKQTKKLIAQQLKLHEQDYVICICKTQMTQDLFFHIMTYLPAYPHFFRAMRVNRAWFAFVERKLREQVKTLDLVEHKDTPELQFTLKLITYFTKSFPNVTKLLVPIDWFSLSDGHNNISSEVCSAMRKWDKLDDLHVFSTYSKSGRMYFSYLKSVKHITLHGFSYLNSVHNHTNAAYSFNYGYTELNKIFEDKNVTNLKNVSKFEDFVAYCDYFYSTVLLFLIVVETWQFKDVYVLRLHAVEYCKQIFPAHFDEIAQKYTVSIQALCNLMDSLDMNQFADIWNKNPQLHTKTSALFDYISSLKPWQVVLNKFLFVVESLKLPGKVVANSSLKTWLYSFAYDVDVLNKLDRQFTHIFDEFRPSWCGLQTENIQVLEWIYTRKYTKQLSLADMCIALFEEKEACPMLKYLLAKASAEELQPIFHSSAAMEHLRRFENVKYLFVTKSESLPALDAKALLHCTNEQGDSLLHMAVKYNSWDKYIVSFVTLVPELAHTVNIEGENALHMAVAVCAEELIDAGADINLRNVQGLTPWMVHPEYIYQVLDKIDTTLEDSHGNNVLHFAAQKCHHGTLRNSKLVIDLWRKSNKYQQTPLMLFVQECQHFSFVTHVPDFYTKPIGPNQADGFMAAAKNPEFIDLFLKCPASYPIVENQPTPLHLFLQCEGDIRESHIRRIEKSDLFSKMLNHVAMINNTPQTPLMAMFARSWDNGHKFFVHWRAQLAEYLKKIGAKGIGMWDLDAALFLVTSRGNVNVAWDKEAMLPVLYGASWSDLFCEQLRMWEAGAASPSWMSLLCKNLFLFTLPIDTLVKSMFFVLATYDEKPEEMALLFALRKADNNNTILHMLVSSYDDPHKKSIRELIEYMKPTTIMDSVNNDGDTALHIAVRLEAKPIITALVTMGASTQVKNALNKTVLDEANATMATFIKNVSNPKAKTKKRKRNDEDDDSAEEVYTPKKKRR